MLSVNTNQSSQRPNRWRRFTFWLALLLVGKALFMMISDYRWYFPANFQLSSFLTGRESIFHGWYWWAFYVHIFIAPITLLLAITLMITGDRPKMKRFHKSMGITLVSLVVLAVSPSGLLMSIHAYSGPVAGVGLGLLSITTGVSAILTGYYARGRNFRQHRRWSIRCFIMLCSPLVLRLFSGVMFVFETESEWTYRASTWLSWLLPLIAYEITLQARRPSRQSPFPISAKPGATR